MRTVKKQPKNWLIYSGLAIQIGSIMYIMSELGQWITKEVGDQFKTSNIDYMLFWNSCYFSFD